MILTIVLAFLFSLLGGALGVLLGLRLYKDVFEEVIDVHIKINADYEKMSNQEIASKVKNGIDRAVKSRQVKY